MKIQQVPSTRPPSARFTTTPAYEQNRPDPSGILAPDGLTWSQYLIWTHQKLYPRAPFYNVPFTFTIHGACHRPRFQQALQAVLTESESLRSIFITTADGQPRRRVLPQVPLNLSWVDLAVAPDPAAAFEAWLSERSRRPFELDQPLFDTALVSLGGVVVWYFNAHHLIVDGAAGLVLYRQVRRHYEHLLATGQLAPLAANRLSGVLAAEADYRRSPDFKSDQAHWQQQPARPLPPGPLYYAPPAAAAEVDTLPGHAQVLELGSARTTALLAWLAQADWAGPNANVALLNFWLGVLAVYAHRLTGANLVSLATPFANRRGQAEVVAPVMTEVPIVATLDGAMTWPALLAQLHEHSAAAYQHRRFPFQTRGGPLPGLVVNLHNWAPCLTLAGAPVTFALRYVASTDKTLITHIRPRHQSPASSLTLELIGPAAQFSAQQLRRTAEHLLNLVDSCLQRPDSPIAHAQVAGADASVWVGARLAGEPLLVTAAFQRQAAGTPGASAAICGQASITYAALQQRAEALAQRLRAADVGPGARVALYLERSLDLLAALLATLFTGAAYVPLDPDLPPERLAWMLADAQVSVAVTQTALAGRLPAGTPVLVLENDPEETAGPPAGVLPVLGHQPAFIIYTSGSTGQPKGVVVSHQALAEHIHSARQAYALTAADRVLQFASISFDTAAEQIFTSLTTGACLVLRGREVWTPPQLAAILRAQRVTVANLPTAYWQHVTAGWAEQPKSVAPLSLRLVLVGGETLMPAALESWRQVPALAAVRVLNVYGPTEATVTSLAADVTDLALDPLAPSVPLGGPLPGRTASIVDLYGAPQPLGVAGELCMSGVGLAEGYWNAPDQTRARFRAGPLGRLYRTGDLAYGRPDGAIGYVGRRDRQVKVRGVRVELAEIEAALAAHPWVRAAAVVAQPAAGEVILTAYVATLSPAGQVLPALREYLRTRLPAAMLPAAWVMAASLPLTLHGKLDYAALPSLPVAGLASLPAPVDDDNMPVSVVEITLLNLWRAVLQQPRLGRHDNFFDAGGHSLLAARLFARLETELGVRLPVSTLAQAGTAAQLAQHLVAAAPARAWPTLVRLTPTGDRPPFFCVHGFGGGVLGYLELARQMGPQQPFWALAARGLDSSQEPDDDVRVMAARYLEVVRAAQPEGPYYLGGYCFGGVVAYELAVQLQQAGQTVAFVGLFEGYAPGTRRAWPRQPIRWGMAFARNLPHWLRDFIGLQLRHWRTGRGQPAPVTGMPADERALARVRHIQAQHNLALQRYVPPSYAGAAHLFRARGHALRRAADPLRGWGRLAAGGVRLHLLPGSHYNILEAPFVAAFAAQLTGALAASAPVAGRPATPDP